jgi:hypothetical protein
MPSHRTRSRTAEKRKITASEHDAISLDSDDLDAEPTPSKRQRKSRKPRREKDDDEDDDEQQPAIELKNGQEVVGVVVQAPKTGRGVSLSTGAGDITVLLTQRIYSSPARPNLAEYP